jgi:hypothetical protein
MLTVREPMLSRDVVKLGEDLLRHIHRGTV